MTLQPIIDKINQMDTSELVQLNNTYCVECNMSDSEIYDNDEEFFENYFPKSYDAIQRTFYGNYSFSDEYVKFNGQGNLVSLSYLETDDLPENVETIAEYIYENQNAFDYFYFDACEEEEEEEEI